MTLLSFVNLDYDIGVYSLPSISLGAANWVDGSVLQVCVHHVIIWARGPLFMYTSTQALLDVVFRLFSLCVAVMERQQRG